MSIGTTGEAMELSAMEKYGHVTVREAGDIAESLGVTLLELLSG